MSSASARPPADQFDYPWNYQFTTHGQRRVKPTPKAARRMRAPLRHILESVANNTQNRKPHKDDVPMMELVLAEVEDRWGWHYKSHEGELL